MSFKDQINKFVGKVRISDIENAFNFIIENVNAFIDTINSGSEFLEDTDNFYLGSTSIPASNYTLTLGALKKILTAYDKEVIGGTVVKNPLNTDKAILFPSLEISKDNGITQIMQTEVDKPSQADIQTNPEVGKVVGYDTVNNEITNQNNVVISEGTVEKQEGVHIVDNSTAAILDEAGTISASEDAQNNAIIWNFSIGSVASEQNFSIMTSMNDDYCTSKTEEVYMGILDNFYITGIYIDYLLVDSNNNVLHQDTYNHTFVPTSSLISDTDGYILVTNRGSISPLDDTRLCIKTLTLDIQSVEEGVISGEIEFVNHGDFDVYTLSPGGTIILPPGQTNPDIIKIADIDWNRDEWVMNTTDDWLYVNPEQSPLISLTVQNPPRGWAVNPDNTKPQFIVPRRYGTYAGERGDYDGGLVRLANGSNIIDNNFINYSKSRNRAVDFVFAPVWVPKGMASTIFPIYGCSIAQYYTLS